MKPKRFYGDVTTVPTDRGRYAIYFDHRMARTPAGHALELPNERLAEAIVDEWRAQNEHIHPETMPLMRLWATAVDRTGRCRSQVIEDLMRFASTDLLCYRDESSEELSARQVAQWQPVLDWAARDLNLVLRVTHGVVPIDQPQSTFSELSSFLHRLSDAELTAVTTIAQISSSVVIGLAVLLAKVDAVTAYTLTFLDEDYQTERWGEASEAAERRRACYDELMAAERFIKLCKTSTH